MEAPRETECWQDYDMRSFDIANALAIFDEQSREGQLDTASFDQQLSELARRSLSHLTEARQRYPQDFQLDVEAEILAGSLNGDNRYKFAVRFNELLYGSISDPIRSFAAMSDTGRLQGAVELTAIADRINSNNFYTKPNRVRELGDAIIGRCVLTMLSLNMDPRTLSIPVRN